MRRAEPQDPGRRRPSRGYALAVSGPAGVTALVLAETVSGGLVLLFLTPLWGVRGLALGVVIGAALHFLVQLPGLVRAGMAFLVMKSRVERRGFGDLGHDRGDQRVTTTVVPTDTRP